MAYHLLGWFSRGTERVETNGQYDNGSAQNLFQVGVNADLVKHGIQ
jgi:hypothetical protein